MEPRIEITRDPVPHPYNLHGKRKSDIRMNLEALRKGECLVLDYSSHGLPHTVLVKKGKNIRSIVHHVKKSMPGSDFTTRFDTFSGVFRIWRTA